MMNNKRLFAVLFFALAFFCHDGKAQTSVPIPNLRCVVFLNTIALVPVAVPSGQFFCYQLDPNVFAINASTTPSSITLKTASILPHNEVPGGAINGTNNIFTLSATPATGYPVLVYRNGLLLTQCSSTTTTCNGDYQLNGATIAFLNSSQTANGTTAIPGAGDLLQVLYWH